MKVNKKYIKEAGGMKLNNRSYRTIDDAPQNISAHQDDSVDEAEEPEPTLTKEPIVKNKPSQRMVKYINKQGKEEERPYISVPKPEKKKELPPEDYTIEGDIPVKKSFVTYDKQGNKIDASWKTMQQIPKEPEEEPQQPPTEDEPKQNVDESLPVGFPKSIYHKLEKQYGKGSPKVYKVANYLHSKYPHKLEEWARQLEEETGTSAVAGYQTPMAFGKGNQNKSRAMQASKRSGFNPVNEEYEASRHDEMFTETELIERELRKLIQQEDIADMEIALDKGKTPSDEQIIVTVKGQHQVLEKEFNALIKCEMNDRYSFEIFESDQYGEDNKVGEDKDLNSDQLKSKVLEFVKAVKDLIAEKSVESLSVDEKKLSGVTKPVKPSQVREDHKNQTIRIINDMIASRKNQIGSRNLNESIKKINKFLK